MKETCHYCDVQDEKIRHFLLNLFNVHTKISLLTKMTFVQSDTIFGVVKDNKVVQITTLENKYTQKFELKNQTIEIKELAEKLEQSNNIIVNLSSHNLKLKSCFAIGVRLNPNYCN